MLGVFETTSLFPALSKPSKFKHLERAVNLEPNDAPNFGMLPFRNVKEISPLTIKARSANYLAVRQNIMYTCISGVHVCRRRR